ncbi:hypothetical protein EYF80_067914 [Liparis tanakae]|uniref:Uncharacterized protein n=1 Tax=Liparis tanakae TaxID=230148 RepID=A0A4Z2DZM2_9TELE|nr:hypothetical protein EYF80_067914 [Liparis tanakae]
MKRSGKRFFLGDSRRSVKYRWWMMLLTCGKGGRSISSSVFTSSVPVPGGSGRFSYHEFKEEPGLLERPLPDAAAAHHPLEGQFFMEELSAAGRGGRRDEGVEVERRRRQRHRERERM